MKKCRKLSKNHSSADSWIRVHSRLQEGLESQFLGHPSVCERLAGLMAGQLQRSKFGEGTLPVAPRLLFVGPASSGKTFLGGLIGQLMKRTVLSCNMATVTPEGFKGGNLMECLLGATKAHRPGVIVIDEIDKVVRRDGVGGWASQLDYSLLPLLGGEEVSIPLPEGRGVVKYSFRDWIIVLAGVFPEVRSDLWNNIHSTRKTIIDYGFSGELASRLTHSFRLSEVPKPHLLDLVTKEAQQIGKLYGFTPAEPPLTEWQLKGIVHRAVKAGFGLRTMKSEIYDLIAQNKLNTFKKTARRKSAS